MSVTKAHPLNCGPVRSAMETIAGDRRIRRRYALSLPVLYRCSWQGRIVADGMARTRDISTSGIGLEAGQELPSSARVELMIGWPVAPASGGPITLMAFGTVTRQAQGLTGLRIQHYEFLNQVGHALPSLPEDSPQDPPLTAATVRINELRRNLCRLLRRVEGGEVLTVYRQSKAIAEIRPIGQPALPTKLPA